MSTLERPFDAMLMHQLVFKIVHGGVSYLIQSILRPDFSNIGNAAGSPRGQVQC